MTEGLAHHAGLAAARLERQRLGRGDTQLLIAGFFSRFSHSVPISRAFQPPKPSEPPVATVPVRNRSRRRKRVRTALLSGPASSAACTTFDRPNAKSNCVEVNALRTTTDP